MRTYAQAVAYAERQHLYPSDYVQRGGLCQRFARSCVGAGPFGGSAISAWHSIPDEHKHSGFPRAGGLAYYDKPHVQDWREFGHVVFVVEGGMVWSTDAKQYGRVNKVPYTWFKANWGMRYLGWIDWTPSGAINLKPVNTAGSAPAYRQGKKVYRSKMHLGQQNSDSVWNVSLALKARRYDVQASDDYTWGLKSAVRRFQLAQGWKGSDADGIVGPMTARKLGLVWVNA